MSWPELFWGLMLSVAVGAVWGFLSEAISNHNKGDDR